MTKKKKVVRINLNGQTGREDLLGKYQLVEGNTVWQDGILLTALKKGYWILLDEINAALPEVLLVLQALLEVQNNTLGTLLLSEKDGELITPHKQTRIFATCNPSDYAGTKDFNQATLSRFIILRVQPLSASEESELLIEKYALDANIANKLAVIASGLRKLKEQGEIMTFISTRDIEQVAILMIADIDMIEALDVCILQKAAGSHEIELMKKVIQDVSGISVDELRVATAKNGLETALAHIKDFRTEAEQHGLHVRSIEHNGYFELVDHHFTTEPEGEHDHCAYAGNWEITNILSARDRLMKHEGKKIIILLCDGVYHHDWWNFDNEDAPRMRHGRYFFNDYKRADVKKVITKVERDEHIPVLALGIQVPTANLEPYYNNYWSIPDMSSIYPTLVTALKSVIH